MSGINNNIDNKKSKVKKFIGEDRLEKLASPYRSMIILITLGVVLFIIILLAAFLFFLGNQIANLKN